MSETVWTPQAMGHKDGLARARALSPERRREDARKAYLAGAVNSVASRVDELTEDQKEKLFNALLNLDGAA